MALNMSIKEKPEREKNPVLVFEGQSVHLWY